VLLGLTTSAGQVTVTGLLPLMAMLSATQQPRVHDCQQHSYNKANQASSKYFVQAKVCHSSTHVRGV